MTTPNLHRGEVAIELAGRSYVLRPTFEALSAIETDPGAGLAELARRIVAGDWRLVDFTAIALHGLRAHEGRRRTREAVGALVVETGLNDCALPMASFLRAGLLGGRAAEASEEPNPPAPATGDTPSAGS
jgi:hypothetical protein